MAAGASGASLSELHGVAGLELVENIASVPAAGAASADTSGFESDGTSVQGERSMETLAGGPRLSVADLTLASGNVTRAAELRHAFASTADGSAVGEKLLQDFVGMETALALSLIDTEGAAIALLQRALTSEPTLALPLAKLAREIESLSAALRRRMQGGLAAAANLRAQRRLLAIPRASDGK